MSGPLSSDQNQQIKEKILLKISEVKEHIDELKELTKPIAPDNAIGRVSRMDAINNRSVNEAALRSAKARLQKLEKALDKSEQSELGLCVSCGEPIRFERLLFMPESTQCISCARKGR
ncbi:MAG: TraR/DksA C4-type zinc finger protein [Bacteroidota bacterium]